MKSFKQGAKEAFPIALGYLWVAFAFGILSRQKGFPLWFPVAVSLTNFTGSGQFVGTNLLAKGFLWSELFTGMFIVNIRYCLMSFSLSQKLDKKITLLQRFLIAFGVTDENFALAISQKESLSFPYLMGLMLCSFSGWVGGTLLGAVLGEIFPPLLLSSLGIALFAMFIAIITPPAAQSKPIMLLVGISILLSLLFSFTPFLKKISSGWVLIIGSLFCTALISLFFPIEISKEETVVPPESLTETKNTIESEQLNEN